MRLRATLTATLVFSLLALCDLKEQQPEVPVATDVVNLADLLSEAERVHPALRAEEQVVEARNAHVPQVKTLPDLTVSVRWMGNIWPFSVQRLDPSSYSSRSSAYENPQCLE